MSKKVFQKVISWILVLVMVITFAPVSMVHVEAATKVSFCTSKVTITEGMIQTLKLKNFVKGSKTKWQSVNKKVAVVNSSGVVKGVKDGTTTIKCTITKAGKKTVLKSKITVKTPKFKKKSYEVVQGEKVSLNMVNKYSDSKYQWSSSDKKIATVNAKGQVTGVSSGSALITVKISIPKKGNRKAKTIKKKVSVNVSDETEVTTQEELNTALKNTNITNLILKTDQKEKYIIPEGKFENVSLTVDAPNADVENYGNFKSITIKQIAADTWTENAKNNVLILDAAAGHVVVPADAGIKEIRVVNSNSSFKLEVQGNIDKISIDSISKVDINMSGTLGIMEVNNRATVSISGSSASPVIINVGEKADGTTINSYVKTSVTASADTEINLSKGAEGSSVKTENSEKSVEVTNNTDQAVTVSNKEGKDQSVASGKNAIVNGKGEVTGTTTPDTGNNSGNASGGGSSSGGSTSGGGSSSGGSGAGSSGDLTRYITYFKPIEVVNAGTIGQTLKTVEELNFPNQVVGVASSGEEIQFPVTSWINLDEYTVHSVVGTYRFQAVLGMPDKVCHVGADVTAIVKVTVSPICKIEYANDLAKDMSVDSFVRTYEDEGAYVYYAIKNNSKMITNCCFAN